MTLQIDRLNRRLALLVAVLLLAAFARLYHLMQQGIWLDEGYTHYVMTRLGPLGAALDDMHPPLYYYTLGGWMAVTGDSLLAMRYFSALCSVLTVPLVYLLARRMAPAGAVLPRRQIALLAALLFALSDPDIAMAQEVRNYAFHKLILVISVLAYARWVTRPTRGRRIAWIAANSANLYTFYLGGLLLVAEGLHALLYLRGRERQQALGSLAAAGVTFLPWFFTGFLDQVLTPNLLFLPEPLSATAWTEMLHLYFTQQWPLIIGLMLLGLAAVTYGADGAPRLHWRPDGNGFLLLGWAALPFAIIGLIGLFRPFFSPRWAILATPAIVLLTARGLGNLHQPGRGLLLAVLLVYSVTTVDFYWPKPPWDRVAANVLAYARPGEPVLLEVHNDDYSVGYYLERALPPESVRSLRMWREATDPAMYHNELTAFLAAPVRQTIWVVAWGENHDIFNQLEQHGFQRSFALTTDHVGNALNVHRYDRRLEGEPLAVYESGLILRRAEVYPEAGRVDLWWSVGAPVDRDYTTSAFALDSSGRLIAQDDTFPARGTRPTTTWLPGDLIYDPHPLQPADLPPGVYSIGVQTYYWADGVKIPTTQGEPWYTVGTFEWP
ncbi:MAG: phospholipid carrier-dependent glycosyltransferase [Anaerolineae bacterium]|nr:phospholipid carrier-dependent glycosyltransferase [Anaerolineae bacterium]